MREMNVRVMIVEDDEEVREDYRRYIKDSAMLQLVAETDDMEEAISILETEEIDAVILDLEMSKGSGLLLLDQMQQMQIEKPFIAVATNVISKVIYDTIRNMGVDYICTKSDSGFSCGVPLSIVEISAPYRKSKESAEVVAETLNARTKREFYCKHIEFELSRFEFSLKNSGTAYLLEAIMYVAMSEGKEISLTKELYPYLAKKFNTNISNVEKNIRNAIEKVWTERDIHKIKEYYPYDWNDKSGRPTNAEFIFNIVQKLFRQ